MSIYQRNPDAAPDDAFEPGALHHVVVGNDGRLLDPRRTPVTVVQVCPERGVFIVRLDDFEDKGARWEVPFEDVRFYQFALGCPRADEASVSSFRSAQERFDRPLTVPCDPAARAATLSRLEQARADAAAWLDGESAFVRAGRGLPDPARRTGDELLWTDLRAYMTALDLDDLESEFARRYVCNPGSGDLVKGHRLVLADLGLVAYEGRVPRDPDIFAGVLSRERRAAHVIARLAFVSALFRRLGHDQVVLYRGIHSDEPLQPTRNRSFVSATFCRAVAESHFDAAEPPWTSALMRQSVAVERLYMTYFETAEMNEPFREAEAVLLWDADAAF